jgi:hypothetical protein
MLNKIKLYYGSSKHDQSSRADSRWEVPLGRNEGYHAVIFVEISELQEFGLNLIFLDANIHSK